MAKLRHLAIAVQDLEGAAKFYEECFEMKRLQKAESKFGDAISLTDGVVNLTLLYFKDNAAVGNERGNDYVGVHHFGFIVENEDETAERITQRGGKFFKKLPAAPGIDAESKYKDPYGIMFDISEHGWIGAN